MSSDGTSWGLCQLDAVPAMLFLCFLLPWEASEEENTEYIYLGFAFYFTSECYSRGIYPLLPACYSNSRNGGGPEKSRVQSLDAQFAAQAHSHILRSTRLKGLCQSSEIIALIQVIIIMGAFNGLVFYIFLVQANTHSMVLGIAPSCYILIF